MITHFIAVLVVCGLPIGSAAVLPKTNADVNTALRTTAIQMYDSFRENRAELDLRWGALEQVEKAWRSGGLSGRRS